MMSTDVLPSIVGKGLRVPIAACERVLQSVSAIGATAAGTGGLTRIDGAYPACIA